MIIPVLEGDFREISPSVLAYVGDAVFELFIRLHLISGKIGKSGELHKHAILHVRAKAQADASRVLLPELSDEELSVFRRGKNSNPTSVAKSASPADYKYATGLEALIGYLYLTDQQTRLDEILYRVLEIENNIEKGEVMENGSTEA